MHQPNTPKGMTMAQTVQIILEDDLDGGPAEETVRFSLDGAQYEIDLSSDNASTLRDALMPFAQSARRDTKIQKRVHRSTTPRSTQTKKIREWAQANGHPVAGRGRIHQHIQDAYCAATK